jgi:hypothetical protein
MSDSTPRERLVATVAVMHGANGEPFETAWQRGEDYVASLEAEPDKPVRCPCCEKLVTLCTKHYRLHQPGKLCSGCREDE